MIRQVITGIDHKTFWHCARNAQKIDSNLESAAPGYVKIWNGEDIVAMIAWKKGNKIILQNSGRFKKDRINFQNNLEYCYEKLKKFTDYCSKTTILFS